MHTDRSARLVVDELARKSKRLKKLIKKDKRKSGRKKAAEANILQRRLWKQDFDQGSSVDIFGKILSPTMAKRAWENRRTIGQFKSEQHAHASLLLNSHLKWERQAVLDGRIFDFYCHEAGAAIEIDGPYHETEERRRKDKTTDAAFLRKYDIRVFRVTKGGLTVKRAAMMAAELEPYAERVKKTAVASARSAIAVIDQKKAALTDKAGARSDKALLARVRDADAAAEEIAKLRRSIALAERKIRVLSDKFRL